MSGDEWRNRAALTSISKRQDVGGRIVWIGILSGEGQRALRRNGHGAVAEICAPDLPPEAVRFVDDSQRQALEATLDDNVCELFAASFPDRPIVTGVQIGKGLSATIALRIQPDLRCFRGHFRTLPVVPGATQLGWALEFGTEMLGTQPLLRAVRSVKFERIIQPGHSLQLHLATETGTAILRFEYASEMGRHSVGRIETRGIDA